MSSRPARCSAYPRTAYPTTERTPCPFVLSSCRRTTPKGQLLLVARATLVVERLPVVIARALVGHPGSEIRLGGIRVVVPVVLAVVPVVPLVRSAVRGLPPVVDVDVVVLLAVVPLLLVLGIVLVTPVVVGGLPVAVVLVAIGFAVRKVSVWVVVLGELTPLLL
jgi:hypothetical protein